MPIPDDLASLLTETRNPASRDIDQMSTLDMLRLINEEDATVAAAVAAELASIARAVDAIALRFEQGGRLFSIGAGTSGRLGRPRRIGVPAHVFGARNALPGDHRRRRQRAPHLERRIGGLLRRGSR